MTDAPSRSLSACVIPIIPMQHCGFLGNVTPQAGSSEERLKWRRTPHSSLQAPASEFNRCNSFPVPTTQYPQENKKSNGRLRKLDEKPRSSASRRKLRSRWSEAIVPTTNATRTTLYLMLTRIHSQVNAVHQPNIQMIPRISHRLLDPENEPRLVWWTQPHSAQCFEELLGLEALKA